MSPNRSKKLSSTVDLLAISVWSREGSTPLGLSVCGEEREPGHLDYQCVEKRGNQATWTISVWRREGTRPLGLSVCGEEREPGHLDYQCVEKRGNQATWTISVWRREGTRPPNRSKKLTSTVDLLAISVWRRGGTRPLGQQIVNFH